MSAVLQATEAITSDTSPVASPLMQRPKSPRVLACVLCQHRKVKCDRRYPCATCIKSRAQCVPATQVPRQRRRRFPERELLDRLRKYEDLLRQNNIKFEPLHGEIMGEKESPNTAGGYDSGHEKPKTAEADWSSPSTTANSEQVHQAKNVWHAMSQEFRESENNSDSSDDDVREVVVKKAWEQLFESNDHLLFGSRKTAVDISTLHPEPVQIFRLWQLYLDNVNPLLKVTHTPSLQGQIIEAASDISNIRPTLEALMFSIYCMSILSLAVDDCQAIFGSSKVDLLARYQFGCQQALWNCGFLRGSDRDCLTALYLYLISVRPSTVPQSLSAMLGVAIRIAQRMGIHSESVLAKCTALEAETRRRLWWSLMLFDTRIGELADSKSTTLTPTWDCRVPRNVNDSDFRLDMKEPPQVQGDFTEALFVVVRSELGDFVRHTNFHLDFTSPALKAVGSDAKQYRTIECSELASLTKIVEDKYLRLCDPENPLHFMTIWTTRAYLAKCQLFEHHSRFSSSAVHQAEAQTDAAILYALNMLECDTKIMTSPLTKGFMWFFHFYFPFTAYIHIVQALRQRPISDHAEQAWESMSDNYKARFDLSHLHDNPFYKIFTKIVLQAWDAREALFQQSRDSLIVPRIIVSIREALALTAQNAQHYAIGHAGGPTKVSVDSFPTSIQMALGGQSLLGSIGGQHSNIEIGPWPYPDFTSLAPLDFDANQLDWSAMDWDLVNGPTGEAGESTGLSLSY